MTQPSKTNLPISTYNPLNKIIAWATEESSIKVVLLTGSMAGKGPRDEFSDYDIAIFTTNIKRYTKTDSWIHAIEDVWVYEPCELHKHNKTYPTRLVIYKDGLQVDYALFDMAHLEDLKKTKTLPVAYNLGYKVLLDKDNLTKDLQPPTYEYPHTEKPSQEIFDLTTNVFFFEAFKEAKALFREDLWHAKIRDWSTKKRLLQMIEWHEKAKHGWDYDTNCDAKQMSSWVSPDTWSMIHNIFARFDEADSWAHLVYSLDMFHNISQKVASLLKLQYSPAMYENISSFIKKIKIIRIGDNST